VEAGDKETREREPYKGEPAASAVFFERDCRDIEKGEKLI